MSDVEYRDVPGFEGYRVGNDGSVWSCLTHKGVPKGAPWIVGKEWKQHSPGFGSRGYGHVTLRRDGARYQHDVHRLVASVFHGPCPEGMECRHLDGDKRNNSASNLQWGTKSENELDKIPHGTHNKGDLNGRSKLNGQLVLAIRKMISIGWPKAWVAQCFGVADTTIHNIVTGKLWPHVEEAQPCV